MSPENHLPEKRLVWVVWIGLTVAVALLIVNVPLTWSVARRRAGQGPLPILSQVRAFALTNQNSQLVRFEDLRGQVWLADIIFTRCAGPCPIITRNLSQLQARLPPGLGIKLISLTADPGYDTPAVLQEYAKRFNADPARWQFLTGAKDQIYRLATQDLLLVLVENKPESNQPPQDLFLHSTKFVLLDRQGRLRAVYDGENPEVHPQVIADAQRLLSE